MCRSRVSFLTGLSRHCKGFVTASSSVGKGSEGALKGAHWAFMGFNGFAYIRMISFRFVSVPGVSVHFVSGSYRFLALAFRFVSGIKRFISVPVCVVFRSGFFPVPFLFVSVVFRFFSFRLFPVPVLSGSCVFRFVSFRFLRFVSFPMFSCNTLTLKSPAKNPYRRSTIMTNTIVTRFHSVRDLF